MQNILKDWMFWGLIIQSAITIMGFCIIKFNDFKHLGSDVQELSGEVKSNTQKLNKIDKKLAVDSQRITSLESAKKK